MNKNIKRLVEDYFSGTEQMNMSINNQAKAQRKADKAPFRQLPKTEPRNAFAGINCVRTCSPFGN